MMLGMHWMSLKLSSASTYRWKKWGVRGRVLGQRHDRDQIINRTCDFIKNLYAKVRRGLCRKIES
jgi:hypothetical protein